MKIRITKKTRRILLLYLAALVALYIVVFQMPKMSDKFETTQVLENGTLEVSCGAEGYIIKDEAVCTADETGVIEYKVADGTVVKKGESIVSIEKPETGKEEAAEEGSAEGETAGPRYPALHRRIRCETRVRNPEDPCQHCQNKTDAGPCPTAGHPE